MHQHEMLSDTIQARFEQRYQDALRTALRRVADEQADAGLLSHRELAYATIRFIIKKGLDPTEYIKRRDERLHLDSVSYKPPFHNA